MNFDSLTSEQRLASTLLNRPVLEWIDEQRHPTPDIKRSWRQIAENLETATGGQVSVAGLTIQRWASAYAESIKERAGEVEWQAPPLPLNTPAA